MSVINSNLQALNSARHLNHTQDVLARSLGRLASGSKIVKPSDDAAGLARSEKLSALSGRNEAATTNVQNAISALQAADSFMAGITKALSRMDELAVLAKDVTKNPADIALYQEEFSALQKQLRETIGGTVAQIGGTIPVPNPLGMFNGVKLFGNDTANPQANAGLTATGSAPGDEMIIPQINLRDSTMGAIIAQDGAGNFLLSVTSPSITAAVGDAVTDVFDERAKMGATQSRLELVASRLTVEGENLAAAVSRIRDVNVANESTLYAKYNILSQTGTAMLAQANQNPQAALKLLQR
ncbi:MAG: flagellin [Opitutaceae bacterium]